MVSGTPEFLHRDHREVAIIRSVLGSRTPRTVSSNAAGGEKNRVKQRLFAVFLFPAGLANEIHGLEADEFAGFFIP